jgi:mannosyltransferase
MSEAGARAGDADGPAARRGAVATVVLLTVAGVALRVLLARDSLVADELSTRWIVSTNGLWGVISMVHTDAEITPPLYFVASWLATRIDLTPELLRAPSLLAGAATIPLVYAVGVRTVGRRAALVATALAACSPFLIFYSTEARGYALMMALVLLSTLALLHALDGRRNAWWILYAACTCGAVYSHYTSVFPLAAQLAWVLWAHPEARRPVLLANAAAVALFLPWLSGLRGDMESETTDILSQLQPFTPAYVRTAVAHWVLAYPYALGGTGVRDLPGAPALLALALALALGLAGLAARTLRGRTTLDRGVLLVVLLAIAAPVGTAAFSAVGSNLFGTRNLAGSWPALALCIAAVTLAAGRRLGVVAAGLAVAAFAVGAAKLLDPDFGRADFRAVGDYIDRRAEPGDVIVDAAQISPGGVPAPLQAALREPRPIFGVGEDKVLYDPFRVVERAPPPAAVVARAAAAAERGRLFLVLAEGSLYAEPTLAALPPRYRRVDTRVWPGITRLVVVVAEDQTASGA